MELFPHNKEAYESAVRLFETENRVCIIRPTGTGKSVIIAAFVNDNPSKRHLLLAPGSHIRNEIQKHSNGKISFSTYTGLKMNDALFVPGSFDFIYLDEFHRLGAEVWGSAVERLLKHNPDAKVLGTSATHIRYLDDNRNMASEIFNDKIATQMSLNYAIVNKILPPPIYVSALYSVQEEVRQMKERILSSKVKLEDKETLIRDLDSKIIDWERSSGLDVVIKKHLGAERRRIIVFCKDWEHVADAQKILNPIFKKIYGHIESLSLYSKKKGKENENSLKLFTGEDNRAIILYTIDKVNEGLHSKNCNTVILLRDTISPIVFYQQIGRAFSIKPANRPLILDLVNNFKNIQLASFKSDFEHELNAHAKDTQEGNGGKEKAAIEFVDEIQDIRLLFDSFGDRIDVWKGFYEKAKAYFKEHGHLYVLPENRDLYDWVRKQRKLYNHASMGKEKEGLLRAIGADFDNKTPAEWMKWLVYLEKCIKNTGKIPHHKSSGYTWVHRQKSAYKKGALSKEQIDLLKNLIPLGNNRRSLTVRMNSLIAHFKNGSLDTADEQIKEDLAEIVFLYKSGKLRKAVLTELRKNRVPIELSIGERIWIEKSKKLLEWHERNGRLPKKEEDHNLHFFWSREKKLLKRIHPHAMFIRTDEDAGEIHKKFREIVAQ
jgi:Helicase associated domain/Helicase conserved C-terminal domain/Type III restriction enzyme, res subunit